jgi:hypothetical protein
MTVRINQGNNHNFKLISNAPDTEATRLWLTYNCLEDEASAEPPISGNAWLSRSLILRSPQLNITVSVLISAENYFASPAVFSLRI